MFVSAMEQPHTEQNRNDPPACLNDVPENRTDRTVTEKKKNDRTIPGQSVGQRIFAQRKTEPTLQQTGKRQNPKNEIPATAVESAIRELPRICRISSASIISQIE